MTREKELDSLLVQYKTLGIDKQIDYEKFYLYSIITHSTEEEKRQRREKAAKAVGVGLGILQSLIK